MLPKNNIAPALKIRRLNVGSAWKYALLSGFVVQLLLILFVTIIGIGQLGVSKDNISHIVDIHMQKQALTKSMVSSARERTVNLFRLVESGDPFERDELSLLFSQNAADFIDARTRLLAMPLNNRERELIELQGKQTSVAVPIQARIVELIDAEPGAAEAMLLAEAIPAQNKVLETLSALDAETQTQASEASRLAVATHDKAKFWMIILSAIALALGLFVASAVIYYTNRASREREHLATHDALTGLPNRMLFMDRLDQELVRAQRHGSLVGVLFVDLDRFKRVNDTLGHASGDMLICQVALRLRNVLRADDMVARLGGDEFVVLITDASKISHILQVVEKVISVIAEPYHVDGRELFSSCSIGVSFYPHDGDTSSMLVKHADTAMYHAKNSGRNRFQLYDRAMNAMAEERLELETDLHYAMERGEFELHYQPQLDLQTGRVHSVEALLRWKHPNKGLLAPSSFLELLEETSGIVSVGSKSLVEACCRGASWSAATSSGISVAVNISGREFWHESLVANVREALKVSGLPPQLLQLELTEGILMQDMDNAVKKIAALKKLGATIAVDDFGTGYSSLAHLKRFPVDCLKIDRYFIKDIEEAPINEAFIGSIIALCNGLGIDMVAEGVENTQQLERLRKLGCTVVQGYLVSRPVPADQVIELLRRDWREEIGRSEQAA